MFRCLQMTIASNFFIIHNNDLDLTHNELILYLKLNNYNLESSGKIYSKLPVNASKKISI